MVVATEVILTLVMGGISIFLIRTILVIRNRRFRFASEGEDDYSGDAGSGRYGFSSGKGRFLHARG